MLVFSSSSEMCSPYSIILIADSAFDRYILFQEVVSSLMSTHWVVLHSILVQLKVLPLQDWCLKDDVKRQLKEFYEKHAKTPKEEMKKARQELEVLLKRFEVELKKKELCKRLEYTGSSFEGLKITSDGLEFDVMCILPGKDVELIQIDECPGFVNLGFTGSAPSILKTFVEERQCCIATQSCQQIYQWNHTYSKWFRRERERKSWNKKERTSSMYNS